MQKVAIVILNTQTWWETVECIESIQRSNMVYEGIVIVENASTNESLGELRKRYKGCDKIAIIRSKENRGFARGNNVGIRYARKKWGTDFVLLLNNDTEIINDNYLEDLLSCYKKGVGVIGSKIKLPSGIEQHDEFENMSLGGIAYQYLRNLCKYYFWYFPFKQEWGKKEPMMWIHGCVILLTPDFFEKYSQLWKYTFLYREEMILSIMLKKCDLKLCIADSYIYHKAKKSTELMFDQISRKRQKLEIDSLAQELIVKALPYKVIKKILD